MVLGCGAAPARAAYAATAHATVLVCVQRAACEARRAMADVAADSTWLSQGGRKAPQPWPLRAATCGVACGVAWRAAWRAACAAACDGVCGTAAAR